MSTAVLSRPSAWVALVAAACVAVGASLVLGASAYLGLVALVVLLVMGTIASLLHLDRPHLGLAVLVGLAVAFPVEFRGPAGVMMSSPFPLSAAVCALWLLHVAIVGRSRLDSSRAVYALLAFLGATLVSFAAGQFPWFVSGGAPLPAQVAQLALFLLSGVLFLVTGHQLQTPAHVRWITWTLIGAGVVTSIVQAFPDQLGLIGRWSTRPGSVGSMFWTWLVAMSLGQALFNRQLPAPVRAALVAVAAFVMIHGIVQVRTWASGWVPPLVAIGMLFFLRFPRATLGLGVTTAPLVLLLGGGMADTLLADEAYSLSTRVGALNTLLSLVERSPVLGMGPANYYYLTENVPILGWYVRFSSHNQYQDLMMQTGLLGTLLFGWFAVEVLLLASRLLRRSSSSFVKAYAAGAIGGLLGSLVSGFMGDWIIPFYYNNGILGFRSSLLFWIFLGGVLALTRLEQRQASEPAHTAPAYRA